MQHYQTKVDQQNLQQIWLWQLTITKYLFNCRQSKQRGRKSFERN